MWVEWDTQTNTQHKKSMMTCRVAAQLSNALYQKTAGKRTIKKDSKPRQQFLAFKGSHPKKKIIFSDFVRKREGGSRTKPTFLHTDNLGSNFKGRGGG